MPNRIDRIQIMQTAHPWITEDHARLFMVSAYLGAHRELQSMPNSDAKQSRVSEIIEECLDCYVGMTEHELKNRLAQMLEFAVN